MELELLKVYKSPFPKVRVGQEYDGGYVICDIPDAKYDTLLAGGIADDISFEEAFCSMYPSAMCYAFDGTMWCSVHSSKNENIIFVKKNIGNFSDENNTNLFNYISRGNNIFVKMDIEGGEIPWLKCLSDEQMDKFEQIVMEFHAPFSAEDGEVFRKINKTHVLVHFHGNNCDQGVREHQGVIVPNIFECTYLHKKYVDMTKLELNTETIPTSIDMANLRCQEDIFIDYPPFVHPASSTTTISEKERLEKIIRDAQSQLESLG